MYSIKEIYYTLQGEGAHTGAAAVFCRFTGCNLWTGREADRAEAKCYFCDTDFVGTDGERGGKYSADEVVRQLLEAWPNPESSNMMVVFTGGEPLLQLDEELIKKVKAAGFYIAVETNGTIKAPSGIDWLTVSPKPNSKCIQTTGQELKLVFPHEIKPAEVESWDFERFFLMPLEEADTDKTASNTNAALDYCLENPQWRLTLQTHKILGID